MDSITLGAGGNKVVLWDEHDNSRKLSRRAIMSITLESADESQSWGEFLTREDAFALLGWLTALLIQSRVGAEA